MKGNKDLYKSEISNLLLSYKMSSELEMFLKNFVQVSFGVEQIKRCISPHSFKFYSKNIKYLDSFIKILKNVSEQLDDVFQIVKNDEYYFISCKVKSYGCKSILIYRNHFDDSNDFFKNVDLKFDFNYLTYDYEQNEIFAKDEKLLEYRKSNYNKDINDQFMNDIRELFCEDAGNEWAYC